MNRKVLVAALLAAIVVFVWSFLAHMVLGLGEAGIQGLPADVHAAVDRLPTAGFYFFPNETDPAKMAAAFRTSAHGILVSTPAGADYAFGRRLGLEFVSVLLTTLLFCWVASRIVGPMTLVRGAVLGIALGLFAHFAIDASYLIWYDFPLTYALARLVEQTVGYALGGAVAGWWLGRA
jgi:hypothetical protein